MKKKICLLYACFLLISRMSCITLTDKEIAPENLERVITHEYPTLDVNRPGFTGGLFT